MIDYEWARDKAIARFGKPTSRIDERALRQLEARGWTRAQIVSSLQDGWCVCEVVVIREHPRQVEVRRVYTFD